MPTDLIHRAFAKVRFQVAYVYDDGSEWAANAISEKTRDDLLAQMSGKVGKVDTFNGRSGLRIDVRRVQGVAI